MLIGVDLDTKMVLAVPGPNKGAVILAKATEEIVRFTLALHQEQAVIVQSDGEPAIKAVVRAVAGARARLGRKTVQSRTLSPDGAAAPVCCWVLSSRRARWHRTHRAAFVRNRFHVIPGLQQTPFELAFGGKRFDQKLCEFGDTVYGQVFRTNKAEPRWVKGIWVGINSHSGANHLMTSESSELRPATPPFSPTTPATPADLQSPVEPARAKQRGLESFFSFLDGKFHRAARKPRRSKAESRGRPEGGEMEGSSSTESAEDSGTIRWSRRWTPSGPSTARTSRWKPPRQTLRRPAIHRTSL